MGLRAGVDNDVITKKLALVAGMKLQKKRLSLLSCWKEVKDADLRNYSVGAGKHLAVIRHKHKFLYGRIIAGDKLLTNSVGALSTKGKRETAAINESGSIDSQKGKADKRSI